MSSPSGPYKARWICEQAHEQLKEELGLDHFEGPRPFDRPTASTSLLAIQDDVAQRIGAMVAGSRNCAITMAELDRARNKSGIELSPCECVLPAYQAIGPPSLEFVRARIDRPWNISDTPAWDGLSIPSAIGIVGRGWVSSHNARAMVVGSTPTFFHHAASSPERWASRWWPRHSGTVNSSLTLRPNARFCAKRRWWASAGRRSQIRHACLATNLMCSLSRTRRGSGWLSWLLSTPLTSAVPAVLRACRASPESDFRGAEGEGG